MDEPLTFKTVQEYLWNAKLPKKWELEMHKTHVQPAFMDGVKTWRIKH